MNLLFSCIGRRGYIADYFRSHLDPVDRLLGTSNTEWTPGFRSVDRAFLVPGYRSAGYEGAVLDLCEREKIGGLLSFMDEDVATLAGFREKLLRIGVIPLLPRVEVAQMCLDKWQAHEFFLANRLNTSATFKELEEAEKAISQGEIGFPLIVKPRGGFGSSNTFVARNRGELEVFFNYHEGMLIQEMLGGDAFNLEIFSDLEGRPLAIVPWRKFQSRLGETEQAITVRAPELLDYGEMLAAKVGNIGPMDVDLFVKDGEISILEMNPRFGGGYPVSHLAGADFPALAVSIFRGERPESVIGNYQPGVAMMKELKPVGGLWVEFLKRDLHVHEHSGDLQ